VWVDPSFLRYEITRSSLSIKGSNVGRNRNSLFAAAAMFLSVFTCSDGGESKSAEDGSGVVTMGTFR
jgi:hypothetical protein